MMTIVPNDAIPSTPDALMVLLGERGGRLTISKPSHRHRAAWRRLLYNTRQLQAAGPDRIVRHRGRDSGDLIIWTETQHSEPTTQDLLEPIPIPERVLRPNPLIAALRTARVGADGWIDTRRTGGVAHVRIHRANKTRTIRLLHAVATEAERRGYRIETVAGRRCPGGFGISINGQPFEITVVEESTRVAHLVTASEQRRLDRGYSWGIPQWDYQPTGRLVFRHGHDSYGGNLAADRTRWTLEDKLSRAFHRLEELAGQAEQRHLGGC